MTAPSRRMSRARLLKLWPLKYAKDRWTVVRLRLAPGQIRDVRPAKGFTSADFAQHVMRLKTKLPSEAFTVVVQPPFVVVGDEAADVVRRRSQQTVKWAVDHLKQTYFEHDPEHILDIWLFKDKASYDQNTRRVFNDRPTTPFGYYSATNRALVMNIATGGGTLVHEIVHPFMASNFPACPSWFNEGLASLYEQSGERDGAFADLRTGACRGCKKPSGPTRFPRSPRSAQPRPANSITKTPARTTARRAISAITCKRRNCSQSTTTSSASRPIKTRPATRRSSACWASATWTPSRNAGSVLCSPCGETNESCNSLFPFRHSLENRDVLSNL